MNLGGPALWQVWAVLSALFAALTAIFAKIGVENVNSDLATLIRTLVVICVLGMIVYATGQFQDPAKISGRTYLFLLLSGLGTGASWLCYFRALKLGNAAQVADRQTERRHGRDTRCGVPRRKAFGPKLAQRFAGRGRSDPGGAALRLVIARSVSDEAIQFFSPVLDCFASLAMTTN